MKVTHWYHWLSGVIFLFLAVYLLWLQPTMPILPLPLSKALQKSLGWVLLAWAIFRGFNGYLVWKRFKNNNEEDGK